MKRNKQKKVTYNRKIGRAKGFEAECYNKGEIMPVLSAAVRTAKMRPEKLPLVKATWEPW